MQTPASPRKKYVMKMKQERKKEKNDYCVKNFVMKGGLYKAVSEEWLNRFQ